MDHLGYGLSTVAVGDFRLLLSPAPPLLLADYREHAELAEDFPAPEANSSAGYYFVAVDEGGTWPRLVVTQRFAPAEPGFSPGVLLVPQAKQLFIGAGGRLLGYEARSGSWRQCWEDQAEFGFWGWRRHGEVALMSAELELAAWTLTGEKLWTTFVEPPWSYEVVGGRVRLDVMDRPAEFDLWRGPGRAT